MTKSRLLILGKLPPPFYGPAVATEIILKSDLCNTFELVHFNTGINENLDTIGKKKIIKVFLAFRNFSRYISLVKNVHPDLILVPISQSTLGFLKDSFYINFGAKSGSKVLLHLRGSNLLNWLKESSSLTRWYFKHILKNASGAIVLGEKLRFLFNDYFPPEKIHVIPNGGNYSFPQVNKKESEVRILCFSNLFPAKGIEDVIDSASILKEMESFSFSFSIAGKWLSAGFREYCNRQIALRNLPVVVYDEVSSALKKELFGEADIFVFTPREPEGHPWVIIEALAAGLPVISTDQGAITESVLDGINGFIVDKNNPQAIARRIEFLIINKAIREKMGLESRKIYQENYTEECMVSNLRKSFEKTLAL